MMCRGSVFDISYVKAGGVNVWMEMPFVRVRWPPMIHLFIDERR